MEEPECANKLLRSMNVTNVRIVSSKALHVEQMQSAMGARASVSE
jgi:hypothetical protein